MKFTTIYTLPIIVLLGEVESHNNPSAHPSKVFSGWNRRTWRLPHRNTKSQLHATWNQFSDLIIRKKRKLCYYRSNNIDSFPWSCRGGYTEVDHIASNIAGSDEERYSRQVYTLGTRAHALIRRATVYIDGPAQSGLMYECAKNLALSGIRHLVIVSNDEIGQDNDIIERLYHNQTLDDLGKAYQQGAKAEILRDKVCEGGSTDLLVEFIRRLNPDIAVTKVERSVLFNNIEEYHNANSNVVLCIDRPHATTLYLNQKARHFNWSFVAVETAGIFGKVFCDFGTEFVIHDVDGETPQSTPLDHVDIVESGDIVVHAINGERHDVSVGDMVRFQYRNGTTSHNYCLVTNVQTPIRFTAKLVLDEPSTEMSFISTINELASSFIRVKIPQTIHFESVETAIDKAKTTSTIFTACDLEKSYDEPRRWASMSCFWSLSEFIKRNKRVPAILDRDELWSLAQSFWDMKDKDEISKHYFDLFFQSYCAKFTPIQAVFGAISSQEVLKAISGLYHPVHQFLLYDCDEVVAYKRNALSQDTSSEISGLQVILGDDIVRKLQSQKIFLVGSGAIGCEILKNLAAMGAGTRNDGKVILTDMDTIEKSNLSRQLLFRDVDIGKFKSAAAHDAALRMNPSMKIDSHSNRVGETEEKTPFSDTFWSSGVDIVLNALDNVDARLYMDKQCVLNKIALVDAGTLGSKGNVQVVVPHQSESYSSSVDPPEPSIPVCTLKNFPYAIAHTIQWGRDLFDGLFERRPNQANQYLDHMASIDMNKLTWQFIQEKGDEAAIEISRELKEDLSIDTLPDGVDTQTMRQKSLQWAIDLATKLFYIDPIELQIKHPLNSVDDEGMPFWSGTRRPPKSLRFIEFTNDTDQISVNENLVAFIGNGARLRVESVLGQNNAEKFTDTEILDACIAYYRNISIVEINKIDSDTGSVVDKIQQSLSSIVVRETRFVTTEFEKDDESNGHVAFVNAASNLRAIVYGIPPVDEMETRRIAGKIVPAMITTTAFVSALSCLELVKLVQNVELRYHRNAFINLALPFFAFTIPIPAERMPSLGGKGFTLWDQLQINESKKAAVSGGIKLKSLLKKIKNLSVDGDSTRVGVVSISVGPYLIFANFLHGDDNELLNSSIWDILREALESSESFDAEHSRDTDSTTTDVNINGSHIDMIVVVEDLDNGDEVELPLLRLHRYK